MGSERCQRRILNVLNHTENRKVSNSVIHKSVAMENETAGGRSRGRSRGRGLIGTVSARNRAGIHWKTSEIRASSTIGRRSRTL